MKADVTGIISELRSEVEHIDNTIRSMSRPDRRSIRTATTRPVPRHVSHCLICSYTVGSFNRSK